MDHATRLLYAARARSESGFDSLAEMELILPYLDLNQPLCPPIRWRGRFEPSEGEEARQGVPPRITALLQSAGRERHTSRRNAARYSALIQQRTEKRRRSGTGALHPNMALSIR